ncbi:hypothetical protein DIPPA_01490, partial [Diplonema papillatum]
IFPPPPCEMPLQFSTSTSERSGSSLSGSNSRSQGGSPASSGPPGKQRRPTFDVGSDHLCTAGDALEPDPATRKKPLTLTPQEMDETALRLYNEGKKWTEKRDQKLERARAERKREIEAEMKVRARPDVRSSGDGDVEKRLWEDGKRFQQKRANKIDKQRAIQDKEELDEVKQKPWVTDLANAVGRETFEDFLSFQTKWTHDIANKRRREEARTKAERDEDEKRDGKAWTMDKGSRAIVNGKKGYHSPQSKEGWQANLSHYLQSRRPSGHSCSKHHRRCTPLCEDNFEPIINEHSRRLVEGRRRATNGEEEQEWDDGATLTTEHAALYLPPSYSEMRSVAAEQGAASFERLFEDDRARKQDLDVLYDARLSPLAPRSPSGSTERALPRRQSAPGPASSPHHRMGSENPEAGVMAHSVRLRISELAEALEFEVEKNRNYDKLSRVVHKEAEYLTSALRAERERNDLLLLELQKEQARSSQLEQVLNQFYAAANVSRNIGEPLVKKSAVLAAAQSPVRLSLSPRCGATLEFEVEKNRNCDKLSRVVHKEAEYSTTALRAERERNDLLLLELQKEQARSSQLEQVLNQFYAAANVSRNIGEPLVKRSAVLAAAQSPVRLSLSPRAGEPAITRPTNSTLPTPMAINLDDL